MAYTFVMAKILKFKKSMKHYLDLMEKRKQANDLWGALEAVKLARANAKNVQEKNKANLLLAGCFFEMKQFDQSLFYFFCALKSPPLRSACFFGIGKILAEQNQLSLALDYFEKTLDFDVFGVFCEGVLAWTQHIKQKMESLDFENQNLQNKAQELVFKKNFFEAKKILYGLKSDCKTLVLLALCGLLEGDLFSAKKFAKKALEKNENSVEARLVLFECYKKTNLPASKKIFCELENFETNLPQDLEKLGLFFARQKKFLQAQKFFVRLAKQNEFDPKAHLFCALVHKNLGDIQNAILSLQNARWLDFENPIYDMFLELIKTENFAFEISKRLPKEVENQKLANLMQVFFGGEFCQNLEKSHTLVLDTEWCFSLFDFHVTKVASQALCGCSGKKAKALLQKLLLLKMPLKQKFLICQNALLSKNFFEFNMVANGRYSSFCLAKNEFQNLGVLKKGTAKAISFSECFFGHLCLLPKILKKAKHSTKNQFLVGQKSSVVACFLLFQWPEVFLSACKFFEVKKDFVEKLKNSQKLLEEK